MSLTPEQRTLRARLAAHTLHARGGTTTDAARAAFASKFEREVDPDGTLDPVERSRRAEHARRAHMTRLSLRSAQKRAITADTKSAA